jgi:hypothetical protein
MRVESTRTIGPIRGLNGTDRGRSDRRLSTISVQIEPDPYGSGDTTN